jgi:hypothetical protein
MLPVHRISVAVEEQSVYSSVLEILHEEDEDCLMEPAVHRFQNSTDYSLPFPTTAM